MNLWPIVLAPLIVLAARLVWLNGQRLLDVTRTGFSWLAGRVGVAADVQLTSVLVDGPTVLIGFRPAVAGHDHLLLSPDSDSQATIARLRRWAASGATVVMWRDRIVGRVELSHLRSGQQVTLTVIPDPVATAGEGRSSRR